MPPLDLLVVRIRSEPARWPRRLESWIVPFMNDIAFQKDIYPRLETAKAADAREAASP